MTIPARWSALGTAINKPNIALEASLKQFRDKVIYYDGFTFMSDLYTTDPGDEFPNEKNTNGYPAFCNGDPDRTVKVAAADAENNWALCVTEHKGDKWYWMQYLGPTSAVHQKVAEDMTTYHEFIQRSQKAVPGDTSKRTKDEYQKQSELLYYFRNYFS